MFAYRVGRPLWREAARAGFALKFRVLVCRDEEAGVYVATSPDLRGLVVEAPTLDELREEIRTGADVLLDMQIGRAHPKALPVLKLHDTALAAA